MHDAPMRIREIKNVKKNLEILQTNYRIDIIPLKVDQSPLNNSKIKSCKELDDSAAASKLATGGSRPAADFSVSEQ